MGRDWVSSGLVTALALAVTSTGFEVASAVQCFNNRCYQFTNYAFIGAAGQKNCYKYENGNAKKDDTWWCHGSYCLELRVRTFLNNNETKYSCDDDCTIDCDAPLMNSAHYRSENCNNQRSPNDNLPWYKCDNPPPPPTP